MAEGDQPPQHNHREKIGLKLNGRSLEMITAAGQLLPILMLVAVVVGVYLVFVSIDHRVTTILARQERGLEVFERDKNELVVQLAAQRAFVVEQMRLAREQWAAQTDVLRRMLAIHEANQDRTPETRLPLEYPGEAFPPPRSGR